MSGQVFLKNRQFPYYERYSEILIFAFILLIDCMCMRCMTVLSFKKYVYVLFGFWMGGMSGKQLIASGSSNGT